jgi:UDP-3-O-[3-hydroxymyristoyl] glucosamine N-acyltransferase
MITRTVHELAELCGATLEGDGSREMVGPATLTEAGPDQVSFLGNPRYTAELESTRAGAVLLAPDVVCERQDLSLLRCANPSRAFTQVIEAFIPESEQPRPGVDPSAVVSEGAEIGEGASVGARCVVEPGAILERDVVLRSGVIVGARARVGEGSVLHAGVILYPGVRVGRRCVLQSGAVIGSDGFGFEPTEEGWVKIPQCGTVVIEDDVEIGANTAIDRGRFEATHIGRGAKIDNLVHVGHNVKIGEESLLIAQVGIAGSAKLGKKVVLAGQVGIVGHLEIGDGARVSAQSGVAKSLEGKQDYFGSPVRPQMEGLRIQAALGKLPDMVRRLRELEARIRELEERS